MNTNRKILCLCLLLTATLALQAQTEKLRVAVFDPTSSGTAIDEGTKIAVREIISSSFVNTGKYTIVERSLLDKVMKEQAFSNTDNVDDSQATELGRLAGANKVVLSVITLVGGRNMLSIKVIDVQTATVDQQRAKVVNSNDLLDFVEPITLELLGEKVDYDAVITSHTNTAKSSDSPQPKADNEGTFSLPAKYSEGKAIVFTCSKFPSFAKKNVRGEVKVFFDEDMIWTGGTEGFTIKLRDPKPGQHLLRVTVDAHLFDNSKLEIPIIGGGGGTFTIDTQAEDYYELKTNIWNFKVKLK